MADPKALPNIKEDLARLRKERQGASALDIKADLEAMRAAKTTPAPERPPSPGGARYDYAASDPAEYAAARENAVRTLSVELVRDNGLDSETARKEAERRVAEVSAGPEEDIGTARARSARKRGESLSNEPTDVILRTVGARAMPVKTTGETRTEKDEGWRENYAANLGGLGSVDAAVDAASRVLNAPTPEMSKDEAYASGVAKKYTDDIHWGLAKIAEGLNPTDTAMEMPNADLVTEGVRQAWTGILGYAEDEDARTAFDITPQSMEEIKKEGTKGVQGIITRSVLKTSLPDVVVGAAEAVTMTGSDALRAINLDSMAEKLDRVGMDHKTATDLYQIIADSRPSAAFDQLGTLYEDVGELDDGNARIQASLEDLRPVDIPDRDTRGNFGGAEWRAKLAAHPETRDAPEFAVVWKAIDGNEDDVRVEWALEQVPYGALRAIDSTVGPTSKEIVELSKRRKEVLHTTGGRSTDALEKMFVSATMAPVVNEKNEVVYTESKFGQMTRLAGFLAEGVYEADIKYADFAPTAIPTIALAAAADLVGADGYARKVREARLPTKAGLDFAAQSGEFDDVLAMLDLDRPVALRTNDPHTLSSYAARVLTNVQMPEFQGPGYSDLFGRAGGDPTSGLGVALDAFDVAVDFANPIDDIVAGGVGQVAKRTGRGIEGARTAPRGIKGRAAYTAALPEVFGKGIDRDANAAVGDLVVEETRRRIDEQGDILHLSKLDSPEMEAAIGTITDGAELKRMVKERADVAKGRVLATAKEMLRKGVTPEVVALRQTPEYVRYAAEHAAVEAARGLGPDEVAMDMRWSEAWALAAADVGAVAAPEEFFAQFAIRTDVDASSAGVGALFQDDGGVREATGQGTIERVVRQTDTPEFKTWFGDSKVVDEKGAPLVVYHGTDYTGPDGAGLTTFTPPKGSHAGSHFGTKDAANAKLKQDLLDWADRGRTEPQSIFPGEHLRDVQMRNAPIKRALEAEAQSIRSAVTNRSPQTNLEAMERALNEGRFTEFLQEQEALKAQPTTEEAARLAKIDATLTAMDEEVSAAIARARPGENVTPVYLTIRNPIEMKDTNWGDAARIKADNPSLQLRGRTPDEIIANLKRAGYDGVVYRNNVEDPGSVSYIAFDPEQIKSAIGNRGTFDPRDPNILHSTIAGKATGQGTIERVVVDSIAKDAAAKGAVEPIQNANTGGGFAPKDHVILDAVKANTTGKALARWVSDNAPDDAIGVVAERIARHVGDVEVKIVEVGDMAPRAMNWATGLFDVTEDGKRTIYLRGHSFDDHGLSYETITHELLHAATSEKIRDGNRKINAGLPVSAATQELYDVFNDVVRYFNTHQFSFKVDQKTGGKGGVPLLSAVAAQRIEASLDKPSELVAYALTNKDVQAWLKTIMAPNLRNTFPVTPRTTVWTVFVSALAKLFGIPQDMETALSRIMGATDRIIKADPAPPITPERLSAKMEGSHRPLAPTFYYEGQPLFQKTKTGTHGSIEPTVGSRLKYLIRIFSTGDMTTVFHEKAHGARFVFGADWVKELARHFDHDAAGNLTRKGEEQAAEAIRYYQRVKMHPDGGVQALFDRAYLAMDRFWFATRNALSARGLGQPVDAPILPSALATYWDAYFNPGGRAKRTAIPLTTREAVREIETVRVPADPSKSVVADEIGRFGKRREFARIDTMPAHIRAALGIEEGMVEMDPVDLYARALGYVTVEKFKQRGWGAEPYVRLGEGRTAVPKSRVKRILDTLNSKTVAAFGPTPPAIVNGNLDMNPMQRAGMQGLINEALRHEFGGSLPEGLRTFDANNSATTVSTGDYNRLHNTLLDMHAGWGARRNFKAENYVSAGMISAAARTLADAVTDREFIRHVNDIQNNLLGTVDLPKYMSPLLMEKVDGLRRQFGRLAEDTMSELRDAKRRGSVTALQFFKDAVKPMTPIVAVTQVKPLRKWSSFFEGHLGDAKKPVSIKDDPAGGGGAPRPLARADFAIDDLFTTPTGSVVAPLDDLESTLAYAPHHGAMGITETEQTAINALRGQNVMRTSQGLSWAQVLADPDAEYVITDALGILQNGTKRRNAAYDQAAKQLAVRLAGSTDQAFLTQLPKATIDTLYPAGSVLPDGTIAVKDTVIKERVLDIIYTSWWEGDWDRMFQVVGNAAQVVGGPAYNQAQAIVSVMMGAKADKLMNVFAEDLLNAGIAFDVEQASTLNTRTGATYSGEIGTHGAYGHDALKQRVQDWLNRIVSYKPRVAEVGELDANGKWVTKEVQNNPGVDLSDPMEQEAYTLANRYLAQLGWQYGKGTFGEKPHMMPDGREVWLPDMFVKYVGDTLEETVKYGGPFAGAQRGGAIGNSWRELQRSIVKGTRPPWHNLNLSAVDSELGRVVPLDQAEIAAKGRRQTAQVAGATMGAVLGTALLGWPGAVLGAPLGRNMLPQMIEGGGYMAEKGRRMAGPVGGVVGGAMGNVAGGIVGALGTIVDGFNTLYPMTIGMARVGMTAGLIVPHAAFFVGNIFGAAFQTYLRTGKRGLLSTASQFLPWFGEPAMIGKALAHAAGWNTVADIVPDPRPFISGAGDIWTWPRFKAEMARVGLESSFVKSQSTNALADTMRGMMAPYMDRLMAHPLGATLGGDGLAGFLQNTLMELASACDNANRIGVFIDQVKRGVGSEEAAMVARQAAFDYGNLSEFERTKLRPVILFYSYLRQSAALFWWTALNHPSRVLGTLRATRGQRYDEMENPEMTASMGMDQRAMLFWSDAVKQGHANQGVATMLPPMTIDMIPIAAEIMGTLGGNKDDMRRLLVGHLTPQAQFLLAVLPFGMDPFSGRDVSDYNVVPNYMVELDRTVMGGLLSDVLQFEVRPQSDGATADYPGAPRYQAKNGKAWWALRNLVQMPPFGRYMDEMGTFDRAAPFGGPGPISTMVQRARAYREGGGNDAFDAFLKDWARPVLSITPGLSFDIDQASGGVYTERGVQDFYTSRDDITPAMELAHMAGIKSYVIKNDEDVRHREMKQVVGNVRELGKEADKTGPIR